MNAFCLVNSNVCFHLSKEQEFQQEVCCLQVIYFPLIIFGMLILRPAPSTLVLYDHPLSISVTCPLHLFLLCLLITCSFSVVHVACLWALVVITFRITFSSRTCWVVAWCCLNTCILHLGYSPVLPPLGVSPVSMSIFPWSVVSVIVSLMPPSCLLVLSCCILFLIHVLALRTPVFRSGSLLNMLSFEVQSLVECVCLHMCSWFGQPL